MSHIIKAASVVCCMAALVLSQTPRKQFEQLTTARLALIPDFVLPDIYKDRVAHPLPASVDNSKLKYFPPYNWSIDGWACANAVGASYCYNYEVLNMQDSANPSGSPKFTYEYTYHMLNSGNQSTGGDGWMFIDVFEQAKKTGILTSSDFGGFEWGGQFAGWASGYDKYYRAMKLRASEYYKIDATLATSPELIKQYLYDHGDQSAHGGLLAVQVNDATWATGTVSGKRVFTKIGGGGGHALTVCGYDDNFDGGAYLLCGNWGEGFYWAPYSLFKNGAGWYPDNTSDPFQNNKYFMGVRIKKNYSPRFTFKVSLTHNQRNNVTLSTGAANSTTASVPTTSMNYYALVNNTGGSLPMCGGGQSSTIELGLDLTDFSSVVAGGQGTFFLTVTSKGGTGQVNSLSLMDYSGATVSTIACTQSNVGINGTITMKIPWTGPQLPPTSAFDRQNGIVTHQASDLQVGYEPGMQALRLTIPAAAGEVRGGTVKIMDVRGNMVLSRPLSSRTFSWDQKDRVGNKVAKGAYIASVNLVGRGGESNLLTTKVLVKD